MDYPTRTRTRSKSEPKTNPHSSSAAPPSKIPLRPRKIRKVSPDANASQTNTVPPAARSRSCSGDLEAALRYLRGAVPGPSSQHPQPATRVQGRRLHLRALRRPLRWRKRRRS
ncbi:hypothetical protein E2542_SST14763 [Spatholobus suberectus]|nr:hypothetical protein E2542_SST14763 [Spatholobus suberectus]